MFFIRGMVTGKWICFYAVRKVTDNTNIDEYLRLNSKESQRTSVVGVVKIKAK